MDQTECPTEFNLHWNKVCFPPFSDQALTLEEFIAGYCMPDKKNGYIKIEIDALEKNIKTEIVSK